VLFQVTFTEDDELESCRIFLVSDVNHWDTTDEVLISSVGWGQNPVCLPVCLFVCLSDLPEECLYEFDSLQGSPTYIISQIRDTMGSMPAYFP